MSFVFLFLSGALSGILGGMGMGGGTLLIPALLIFFSVSAHDAAAINLISFVPTAIISLVFHFRNGLVRYEGLFWVILPALVFAVAAFFVSRAFDGEILSRIFGWFLIALAAFSVASSLWKKA